MINYASLADRLEAALRVTEAVGVVITSGDGDGPPAGTAEASCVHWSSVLTSGQARRTAASDHAGCSVGRYVHGMSTLEQTATAEDTATLVAAGWVEPDTLERLAHPSTSGADDLCAAGTKARSSDSRARSRGPG